MITVTIGVAVESVGFAPEYMSLIEIVPTCDIAPTIRVSSTDFSKSVFVGYTGTARPLLVP